MNDFSEKISELAVSSMLKEAWLSPKPGLVDRYSCGAHDDMDHLLFIKSAESLRPYFRSLAELSYKSVTLPALSDLRPLGIKAEKTMFKATGGVNTHKGAIFSLGLLIAALSFYLKMEKKTDVYIEFSELNDIRDIIMQLASGINSEERTPDSRSGRYIGDAMSAGARLEAEKGYPDIFSSDLPRIKNDVRKYGEETALCISLLHFMSTTEDTNIISRGGSQSLKIVQEKTRNTMEIIENTEDPDLIVSLIHELDIFMIGEHLSPGGSADKLIMLIFLLKIMKMIS